MRNVFLFVLALLAGILSVALVAWGTGSNISAFRFWYWLVAVPGLCIGTAVLGYLVPTHAYRWGLAPILGQWLWQYYAEGSQIGFGNLGPFAHVVVFLSYALTAIPCIATAGIAAYLSRLRSIPGNSARS
jgi:hypothetical protein